jgi:hypothetical protein
MAGIWALTIISDGKPDRYIVRVVFNDGEAWFPAPTEGDLHSRVARKRP